MRLLKGVDIKKLCILLFILLLATYTHFYGVVLSISLLSSLIIINLLQKDITSVKYLLTALAIFLLCSSGISVYILTFGDHQPSTSSESSIEFVQFVRFLYRQLAHQSIALNNGVVLALIGSIALLTIFAFFTPKAKNTNSLAILLPISIGFASVIIGTFLFQSFDATKPTYSIWMIPGIYLFLGSRVGTGRPILANILGGVILASTAYGAYNMIQFGYYFAHGPFEKLANSIESHTGEKIAIIYEPKSNHLGMTYFPLSYLLGKKVSHYQVGRPEYNELIPSLDMPEDFINFEQLSKFDRIYVLEANTQSSQEVKSIILNPNSDGSWPKGTVSLNLDDHTEWKENSHYKLNGWTGVQVYEYVKKNP